MMFFYLLAIAAFAKDDAPKTVTCKGDKPTKVGASGSEICVGECTNTGADDTTNKFSCADGNVCTLKDDNNIANKKEVSPVAVKVADAKVKANYVCKPQFQRCAKNDAATAKCTVTTDSCVKVADDKECDQTGTTRADTCYCKPAAPAPEKPEGVGEGLGAGAIAGIVIGSIIGVAGLAVGGYFLYKHCSKKSKGKAGRSNKKPKRV